MSSSPNAKNVHLSRLLNTLTGIGYISVLGLSIASAFTSFGPHFHVVSAVIVGLFCVAAWVLVRNDAHLGFRIAERCYLLGYIATISGLGAVGYQISLKPDLLTKDGIPEVLYKGALALLSTIVGLIFMNIIKGRSEHLEHEHPSTGGVSPGGPSGDPNQWLNAIQDPEIARNLGLLVTALQNGATSMGALNTQAANTQGWMQAMEQKMQEFNAAMDALVQMSTAILPVWQQIAASVQTVPQFNDALAETTPKLQAMSAHLETGNEHIDKFVTTLSKGYETLVKALDVLGDRVSKILPMTTAVQDFANASDSLVKLTKTVAPMLMELGNSLKQMSGLSKLMDEFVKNMTGLNSTLLNIEKNLQAINKQGAEFVPTLDSIATELTQKLKKLSALSGEVDIFLNAIKNLGPTVDLLGKNVQVVGAMAGKVGDLQTEVQGFGQAAKDATTDMAELRQVLADFAATTAKIILESQARKGPSQFRP